MDFLLRTVSRVQPFADTRVLASRAGWTGSTGRNLSANATRIAGSATTLSFWSMPGGRSAPRPAGLNPVATARFVVLSKTRIAAAALRTDPADHLETTGIAVLSAALPLSMLQLSAPATLQVLDADLSPCLVSPMGAGVRRFKGVGGHDFTACALQDPATAAIGYGPRRFTGNFGPWAALSMLDDKPVSGDWTLRPTDNMGSDAGQVNNWSLGVLADSMNSVRRAGYKLFQIKVKKIHPSMAIRKLPNWCVA